MSAFRADDAKLKDVLAFFGLTSEVRSHDYESTILPVVNVGEDRKPLILREAVANVVLGDPIFTVPDNELWDVYHLGGLSNQTVGTVAYRWSLSWSYPTGGQILVPFFQEVDNVNECLSTTHTLNVSRRWVAYPRRMIVGPGNRLTQLNLLGDGTRVMASCTILYRKLSETLEFIDL